MRRRNILTLIVLMLVAGVFLYAASGKMFIRYSTTPEVEPVKASARYESFVAQNPSGSTDRRMVDMTADDSYLIEKGDSTIFILVGNFAAHHNGAVIVADSAVRYSNQSFECFGNVMINQNTTYIYGERAEYNRMNNTAKVFSRLVKVVDDGAVMYTYNCKFNTAKSIGEFGGGCYVEKDDNLLEADRGYYNTKTHELKAVERVEMRNNTYQVLSDSVIFNTQTEDAQYFTHTHIWNDKDEYLYADAGTYTKRTDLHHLTRNAYMLSPEREVWSDTVMYYRDAGHIIARRNIQVDDTTQKVLGFADYAEWWDEPGNAFFTRRPSMINYDPELTDSIYLSADTVWLYTMHVRPEPQKQDTTAMSGKEQTMLSDTKVEGSTPRDTTTNHNATLSATEQRSNIDKSGAKETAEGDRREDNSRQDAKGAKGDKANKGSKGEKGAKGDKKSGRNSRPTGDNPASSGERAQSANQPPHSLDKGAANSADEAGTAQNSNDEPQANNMRDSLLVDEQPVADSTATTDSLAVDSTTVDSVKYSAKQLRRRAKAAKRAVRDSIRGVEKAKRDSIRAIEQARKDSIQKIQDSILRMKLDTIIAERIARSSRLADEEKARIERVKQKAEERRRHKIDKAKARAAKRGKVYTGEDYDPSDTITRDTILESQSDTTTLEEAVTDSLQRDSLGDSLQHKPAIPADSVYKMVKAYRRVKMFRSDSQMVCDSLVTLNSDSVMRMYINPVMWNENNQIASDSAWVYTARQKITRAHFMGAPIMGAQIDTMTYNQVKGKDMNAYFNDGQVYRYDVDGNAQTLYYMQEEDAPDVTALMYIESSAISFYLDDGQMDQIVFKQNPEYVLYPMSMIPETQVRILQGFEWCDSLRPTRRQICNRTQRPTKRVSVSKLRKPTFPIVERIDYDRRRLVENRMWEDRSERLSPAVIEWRNSCPSYKNRRK